MDTIKRIAIVGVLDNPASTNISMGFYLAKLGFEIIPINYRTIIQSQGMEFFENHLLYILNNLKPDLIIFSKCNGINPELVKECTKYTKTWLFNMDPLKTLEQCPEVIKHMEYSTYSSSTALDMVVKFKRLGIKNHYHIIQGTDPYLFKPVEPEEKYKADISLIGSRTPERDEFLDHLIFNGIDAKFYGYGYNAPVFNEEFSKVCASSKFMLSMNTYNNEHIEYFSNRLVRYLSCGTFTFHYDDTGSLEKYFKHRTDLVYFRNKEDLLSKIREFSNYPLEEVAKIVLHGRERVLKYFTWEKILNYMINLID